MGVRCKSTNSWSSGTAGSVGEPNDPVTPQNGDLILCFVNCNDASNALTVTDNNGSTPFTKWSLNELRNTTTGHAFVLFYRVRQSGDPTTYNFTLSEENRGTIHAVAMSNPDTGTPFDTSFSTQINSSATDPLTVPSVTTANANAIHFSVGATDQINNVFTSTPGSPYTVLFNTGEKLIGLAYRVMTTPGATGTTSWSDGNVATKTGISFAVRDIAVTLGPPHIAATTAVNTPTIGGEIVADMSNIEVDVDVNDPDIEEGFIVAPATIASTAQLRTPTVENAIVPLLTLINIFGSIYDARTGEKVVSGQLRIRPNRFIPVDGQLVAPKLILINIPSDGNLNFQLAPSNGVEYIVELDPNVNDPTPLALKSGYFMTTWDVPNVGPVNLATL